MDTHFTSISVLKTLIIFALSYVLSNKASDFSVLLSYYKVENFHGLYCGRNTEISVDRSVLVPFLLP
jgi:hypothetical protein